MYRSQPLPFRGPPPSLKGNPAFPHPLRSEIQRSSTLFEAKSSRWCHGCCHCWPLSAAMPFAGTERWPCSAVAFAIADGWQKIRWADDKLAAHAACLALVKSCTRLCGRQQEQGAAAAAANERVSAHWQQQQHLRAYGQVRSHKFSGSVRVLTPACSSRSHRQLASARSARRQRRRGASVDS